MDNIVVHNYMYQFIFYFCMKEILLDEVIRHCKIIVMESIMHFVYCEDKVFRQCMLLMYCVVGS